MNFILERNSFRNETHSGIMWIAPNSWFCGSSSHGTNNPSHAIRIRYCQKFEPHLIFFKINSSMFFKTIVMYLVYWYDHRQTYLDKQTNGFVRKNCSSVSFCLLTWQVLFILTEIWLPIYDSSFRGTFYARNNSRYFWDKTVWQFHSSSFLPLVVLHLMRVSTRFRKLYRSILLSPCLPSHSQMTTLLDSIPLLFSRKTW